MAKETKTNAMRILDRAGVAYSTHTYDHSDGKIDGAAVAVKLGQDARRVFKTLVTKGKTGSFFVFALPANEEMDLKKAAGAVGEKSVAMIPVADLFNVTGYIRGGCSPLGMKKLFPTVFDVSMEGYETILVSGGRIGCQIEISPKALLMLTQGKTAPLLL